MKIRVAVLMLLVSAAGAGCAHESVPVIQPVAFPPRPTEVRTDDLAPCSMISPAQAKQLDLDEGEARVGQVNGQRSPVCIWLSESDLSYSAQTIPVSAELARSEPGAEIIDVDGFGAVRSVPRELAGGTPICQVTVDAGPGQSIRVQAQATGERPRTDEEMCRIATDVTGMVMTTVVATARR